MDKKAFKDLLTSIDQARKIHNRRMKPVWEDVKFTLGLLVIILGLGVLIAGLYVLLNMPILYIEGFIL